MLTDTQMLQAMHFRSSVALQVTLDQDYNVPDNKSDIEKVIVENGEIQPSTSRSHFQSCSLYR